ncbi:MAG: flagellar hook-length control protein FliK [Paracoccaceae bacterium]|uniref:flagellar hook-length control protein FliK n=1 Tax=Candidatus Salinivivens marinus TaxID=3381703 RepID=UPI003886815E
MTVIGNNSANNSNPLANISVTGAKGTDGSTGVTSFLDIISMLSSSAQTLDLASNTDLLVTQVESEMEPSTLALLQKFLDQEQISVPLHSEISSEDVSTGAASKFIDFLNKEAELKKIKAGSLKGVIDADVSVNQNVLLNKALNELKTAFPGRGEDLKGDNILTSNSAIIENPATNFLAEKLPEVSKRVINTSIMEDPQPKVVSIDLSPIIKDLPAVYDDIEITKIFVNPNDLVKSSDNDGADPVNGAISKLEALIKPNSAEVLLKTDNHEPMTKVIDFEESDAKESKTINLEIDKLKNTTLLFNLRMENLHSGSNFPQKVNLRFSEPKSPSTNLTLNISDNENAEFINDVHLRDFMHAAAVSNSSESEGEKSKLDYGTTIQIFMSKDKKELLSRQSLNFVSAADLSEDFAEKLISRLNSLVSGEFDNRQMLNNLRSEISKNEAIINLDDNLRLPISDLLAAFKRKTKNRLMVSTADVVSYRDALNSNEKPGYNFQWVSAVANKDIFLDEKIVDVNQGIRANSARIETSEAKLGSNNLIEQARFQAQGNPADAAAKQNMPNIGQNAALNSLNLYEAQFSSRLGMLLADQIAKGSENFELQLEPESFGKVRVNVSLERSNVEVKMIAENSAAVMALRGSESVLQVIAEQNGLKLSEYSVDMQNNQNGDNTNRKDGSDRNKNEVNEVLKETDDENTITVSENGYNLNLLA